MNKPLSFEEWADTMAKTYLFSQMAVDYAKYYHEAMTKQAEPEQDEWHYLDWKPEEGETYYTIGGDFQPVKRKNRGCIWFTRDMHFGLVFQTREQAEYHLRMIDLAHEVKKLSFKPDWMNEEEYKYFLNYRHEYKNICIDYCLSWQRENTYFEKEQIAQQALALFENDADFLYCLDKGLI